jgi:hypothetical protein
LESVSESELVSEIVELPEAKNIATPKSKKSLSPKVKVNILEINKWND